MKKRILIIVSIAVVVLLGIYGPRILELYRLQEHVSTLAASDQADGGVWPRPTDVCLNCHGVRGNSLNQAYPSLAGQPGEYVAAQLRGFASGQRVNAKMGPLAMSLSDLEIKQLSEYYAKQVAAENRFFKPDSKLQARGEQLVSQGACAACHGAKLTGQGTFPRLAGQGYDYLLTQLDAFAAESRTESSGTMKRLTVAMSQEDRVAVANYLASVDPRKDKQAGHAD